MLMSAFKCRVSLPYYFNPTIFVSFKKCFCDQCLLNVEKILRSLYSSSVCLSKFGASRISFLWQWCSNTIYVFAKPLELLIYARLTSFCYLKVQLKWQNWSLVLINQPSFLRNAHLCVYTNWCVLIYGSLCKATMSSAGALCEGNKVE